MPELTPQDRESYQKLYKAAEALNKTIPHGEQGTKINSSFTLKELTSAFFSKLTHPDDDSFSFEQLPAQVELTGGYLAMYRLFTQAIDSIADPAKKADINKHYQELLKQYNQIKVSLDAVDDDILEDVTIPYSDPLFLSLLPKEPGNVKKWTEHLMANQSPALTDSEIQQLIVAWENAVTAFVEDAENQSQGNVDPGKTDTIAHFFCIHEQLEGLYSELSTAAALNS